MSCYITQKPETIEEEIEFSRVTKETAAHFSLALDREGLNAASKQTATIHNQERKGGSQGRSVDTDWVLLSPEPPCVLFVPTPNWSEATSQQVGYSRVIKRLVLRAASLGSNPSFTDW